MKENQFVQLLISKINHLNKKLKKSPIYWGFFYGWLWLNTPLLEYGCNNKHKTYNYQMIDLLYNGRNDLHIR